MMAMKTYETVAQSAGLTPKTRQRYIAYMRHRWPQEEAVHCQVGYAMEWAERFKLGIEYMASDTIGQRFLKTYNAGGQP